jgi:hypothetical protein
MRLPTITELERTRKKAVLSQHLSAGTEKTTKNLGHDSRWHIRGSNRARPEGRADLLCEKQERMQNEN